MLGHIVDSVASTRWSGRATDADEVLVDRLETRRRNVQVALGIIWLVDAALQFQPFMFTKAFVSNVLAPTASGNPWLFYRPMVWADHFMIHDIAWWNTLYAMLQLLIALGLFWRPTVRLALGTSIVWSVTVWWFAEGFGGAFSGSSPLAGEPGAVMLYALVAVLIWPTSRSDASSVAQNGPWGQQGAIAAWIVLWVDFAVYFLIPANRMPQALHDLVYGMASGEPGWVQSIDRSMAAVLAGRGLAISLTLALLSAGVALAIMIPPLVRPALITALVVAGFIWLAQDFGCIFTSQGTDVNSGPLIAILAWTFWPLKRPPRTSRR